MRVDILELYFTILDILDIPCAEPLNPFLAQRHPAVAGLTRELARHEEQPVLTSASSADPSGDFRDPLSIMFLFS